jgi:hypothetical protein
VSRSDYRGRGCGGVEGPRGKDGRDGGTGRIGISGAKGRWGISTTTRTYRLLLGVRWTGFHVEPGTVVGGSRVLSGTVE